MEDVDVDAVADDVHARALDPGAHDLLGHPRGDGQHGRRPAQRGRLREADRREHRAGSTGRDRALGPHVGDVGDVGDPAQRRGEPGGEAGRGRGLVHDDVGPRAEEQPRRQGHVEAEVRGVAAHGSVGVAQDGDAPGPDPGVVRGGGAAGRGGGRDHLHLGPGGDEGAGEGPQPEGRCTDVGRVGACRDADQGRHDRRPYRPRPGLPGRRAGPGRSVVGSGGGQPRWGAAAGGAGGWRCSTCPQPCRTGRSPSSRPRSTALRRSPTPRAR